MTPRRSIVLAALLAMTWTAPCVAREDGPGKIHLGFLVGKAHPVDRGASSFMRRARLDDALDPSGTLYERLSERLGGPFTTTRGSFVLDDPFTFSVFAAYPFSPALEGRLSLGYYRAEASGLVTATVEGSTGPSFSRGTLTTDLSGVTVSADLRRNFRNGRTRPFLGLGVRFESISSGDTRGSLGGLEFSVPPTGWDEGYLSPFITGGFRAPVIDRIALEVEALAVMKAFEGHEGINGYGFDTEYRAGISVALSGAGARPSEASEKRPPPPEEGAPPPEETDLRPPPEKGGPCDWVKKRFRVLVDGFPMPDPDVFCRAAEVCQDAARKTHAADEADARLAGAKAKLARTEREARDFADFLGSDAAARNQAGDPGLAAHYREVTAGYAARTAREKTDVAAAEKAAAAAREAADDAAKACEAARAAAEAELARLRKATDAWKGFQADLARCVKCGDVEILDRKVGDILKRIRDARKACEDALLGRERSDLTNAEAAYEKASDQAAADAAGHDAAAAHCADLAEGVRAAYRDCYDRSLTGLDHVEGGHQRGYPARRTAHSGLDTGELGPVWFRHESDAHRFYKRMEDCLRARVNGRVTKPNPITLRRNLRNCKKAEKRAWRKAQRSQQKADQAEAAVRAARARLGDAGASFGPFDDLEAWAAGWSALMAQVGKDCDLRVKRCGDVRREGENGVPPLPADCDPAGLRDRAQAAADRAEDASDTIDGLMFSSCGGGRAAVARAQNDAKAVLGDHGALSALVKAIADRDAALAEARKLLAEGRCEEAAAAYRRARDAAQRAATACNTLKRLVAKAEASAKTAAEAADGCKQDDDRRRKQENDRRTREADERREAAQRAAAAKREAAQAAKRAEEDRIRRARECAIAYDNWLIENLGPEQAREELQKTADIMQELAQSGGEAASALAEAAATGKPPAGIIASGISSGIFEAGVGFLYMWMQWQIEGEVARLDKKINLGRAQIGIMNTGGPCGSFPMGADTYFFTRSGDKYLVYRISETAGIFGGKKLDYMGAISIR
jgi:hypothetical protein